MIPNIEKIISENRKESDAFIKIQQKRIEQLRSIQKKPPQDREEDRKKIIKELQASGILDKNGKLAKPYSNNA